MARWVIAEDGEDSSSSSSDSEEEVYGGDQQRETAQLLLERIQEGTGQPGTSSQPQNPPNRSKKLVVRVAGNSKNGSDTTCHVCGEQGHFAGFVGATYIDCINKPCYLCGVSGHSTATCPHRIDPSAACSAATDVKKGSLLTHLRSREREGRAAGSHSIAPRQAASAGRWHVDAAVLKLHARRTTCLEFHPTRENIVLSGDKSGQIAVWDLDKVFERTVYTDINRWLTNSIRFLSDSSTTNDATCATSSYEGTVKLFDCEVGISLRTLVNANPRGWEHVVEEDKAGTWATFLGLDVMPQYNAVVAGDSKGRLYFLDPRAEEPVAVLQGCKKKTKVQSVDVNPVEGAILLVGGNDHHARIFDARRLHNGCDALNADNVAEVAAFAHPRVINGASFSRVCGRKMLTTCQDNRLRVWDYWAAAESGSPPDREIVHSHNFNRHLTAFRAEWDPKDPSERVVVVGRYISEDVGGIALHPVDIIDAATGALVDALADPNLGTICPVNKPHPRRDVIVTGSSRSLYAWKPVDPDDESDYTIIGEGTESFPPGDSVLRPNSKFLFFDADERAQGKKTRRKGGEGKTVNGKRSKQKEEDLAKYDSETD